MIPTRHILALCLVSSLTLMFACSKQGEGERCDRRAGNNGSDDCQSGLVCTAQENLNGRPITDNADEGRCCPGDRRTATETVCKEPGVQRDSGAPTETPIDASADGTLTDSAGDDASDALADADDAG